MQSQDILNEYRQGRRDFSGLNLDDKVYDFSSADLSGVNFSKSFILANFRGASLKNVDFSSSNVKTCIFDEADLSEASFKDAAIDGASFKDARMIKTEFSGANFYGNSLGVGEYPTW